MTMIERIARAMCESDGADWNAASSMKTANGETPEEQRQYWTEKALAAVRALREPDEAEIEGVLLAVHRFAQGHETERYRYLPELSEEAKSVYGERIAVAIRAYVDSILSQPQEEKVK